MDTVSVKDIFKAISAGDFARLKVYLSSGIKVDITDENGMTPLQQACFSGQTEMVEYLIQLGANVNSIKHKEGYTALMFAGIAGKLNIVEILLQNGARINDTNRLKRTASQMAAFVGNHGAVSLINNFIEKEDLLYFTTAHGLSSEPKLDDTLVNALHRIITQVNFTPTKVLLILAADWRLRNHVNDISKTTSFIEDNTVSLLSHSNKVVSVLEELCNKNFTPHHTNEAFSIKAHMLSCLMKIAGNYYKKELATQTSVTKNEVKDKNLCLAFPLNGLIKKFLLGENPHGLPGGQERFLRQVLTSFPHRESVMWQQLVRQISRVAVGESPTAMACLVTSINGVSPFAQNSGRRTGKDDNKQDEEDTEPCATCGAAAGGGFTLIVKRCPRCYEVAYCDANCQRLHWFTHKQFCPILKEAHDAAQKATEIQMKKLQLRDEKLSIELQTTSDNDLNTENNVSSHDKSYVDIKESGDNGLSVEAVESEEK